MCLGRISGVSQDSWEFLGIPRNSWGFLRIPGDSKGFLRILRSQDHGDSRVSVGFCLNPWGFLGILRVSSKSVRGFLSVEPLDLKRQLTRPGEKITPYILTLAISVINVINRGKRPK